ncbi:MAG: hypothetical protein LBV41_06425 [Cytophagaceae bacterium]|jgi:hypothetical protein|nr:hypothetical protein [Cytophagaceae bacterium]
MIPVFQSKTTLFLVILFVSCSGSRYDTAGDYFRYIEECANGLKISKSHGGIELTARYLPPELKVMQELGAEYDSRMFDSLCASHAESCSFLFTIAPDKNSPVSDLNYYGIASYDQFAERKKALNWYIEECFILKTGQKEYLPKLFHFEQDYGISGTLKFHLVFVPDGDCFSTKGKSGDAVLQFNDPYYGTGQTEFVFKAKSLRNIPTAKIKS